MSSYGSPPYGQPNGLTKLPQELIVRVLEHCGFRAILSFSETCRAYLALVTHSARLQLKIELGANGLELPSSSGDTIRSHELLEKLTHRRDSWLDLRLDTGESLPRTTSGQRFTLWELRSGIFASAFYTGELRPLEANAVKMMTLDRPISDWTLAFDFLFHELTIDPAQDLLVLATSDDSDGHRLVVRFCSLRTGAAHPCAKQSVIPIEVAYSVQPHAIYSTVSLVITDHLLLISLIAHATELFYEILVWDWHAGVLLAQTGWRSGLCGATFLDLQRFIVYEAVIPNSHEEEPPAPDVLNLLIYDIPCAPAVHPSKPTLKLEFPALGLKTWILSTDFLLRSAPISHSVHAHNSEFILDPTCRILSLSMRLLVHPGVAEHSVAFLVFVDSGRLFASLAQAKLEGLSSLPWDAWGEHATRWIRYNSEPNPWINWLHGTKYVLGRQVVDDQPEVQDDPYLAVAEFHTPLIQRSKTRISNNYVHVQRNALGPRREAIKQGQWGFFTNYQPGIKLSESQLAVDIVESDTPTVVEDLGPVPIVSRLPYRLIVSRPCPSVRGCSDWMIDDHRIVGIGPNPDTGQFGDLITIQTIQG